MSQNRTNPFQPSESASRQSDTGYESVQEQDRKKEVSEKLVVLATFGTAVEAHQLRNELENNGIAAQVANETTTTAFGMTMFGQSSAFWIEVLVKESDAERALPIKKQFGINDDVSEIPEWTCVCGQTVDAGFSACWSCESPYKPTSG